MFHCSLQFPTIRLAQCVHWTRSASVPNLLGDFIPEPLLRFAPVKMIWKSISAEQHKTRTAGKPVVLFDAKDAKDAQNAKMRAMPNKTKRNKTNAFGCRSFLMVRIGVAERSAGSNLQPGQPI